MLVVSFLHQLRSECKPAGVLLMFCSNWHCQKLNSFLCFWQSGAQNCMLELDTLFNSDIHLSKGFFGLCSLPEYKLDF